MLWAQKELLQPGNEMVNSGVFLQHYIKNDSYS